MSKRLEMSNLLYELRYQLMHGAHTFSACSREGCDNSARGGRACPDCLEGDIDRLLGFEYVGGAVRAKLADYSNLEGSVLEMAEKIE